METTSKFYKNGKKAASIGGISLVGLLLLFQTFQDVFKNDKVEKNSCKIEKIEKRQIEFKTKLDLVFKNVDERFDKLESTVDKKFEYIREDLKDLEKLIREKYALRRSNARE